MEQIIVKQEKMSTINCTVHNPKKWMLVNSGIIKEPFTNEHFPEKQASTASKWNNWRQLMTTNMHLELT